MVECEKCKEHTGYIEDLQTRVSALEKFVKWAKPILEDIILINNNLKWMKWAFSIFVLIVAFVYTVQVYPSFQKQNDDKIEIITEVKEAKIESLKKQQKFKEEIIKEQQKFKEDMKNIVKEAIKQINEETVKASKINYKATKKVIEKQSRSD